MNSKHSFIYTFLLYTLLLAACSSVHQNEMARNYNNEAYKRFKNKDYQGVISMCHKALEYDPKNAWAFGEIAAAYKVMGMYDSAITNFDSAIYYNPKNGFANYNRAEIYSNLSRYQEAIADYSKSIQNKYRKACSYNERGAAESKLCKYDEALKDYDSSILEEFYTHKFIYNNKADVYINLGKYDSAIQELDKCIKADPKQLSFATHVENKNAQDLLKQKDALMRDTCFVKQMKCFVDAYTRKGYINILLGKYKEASLYLNYERLLPIPSYTQLVYRSYIPFDTMQFDVSNQYLDSAIALDPKSGYAYMCKGSISTRLGKYDEALRYYNKTIEVDTTTNYRYDNRGALYILMDSLDAAIADFNTAIKIDNNKPTPWEYNARGYAYFLKKQYKEALSDYDSAIKVSKTYYQPYYNYKEEAMRALQKNTTVFCTLVEWQAPINDINGLVDNAKFHIADGDVLAANFKITSNRPFEKDKLFVMVDGQSVAIENSATLSVLKEDTASKKYQYGYAIKLNLQKGQHLLYLDYDGKSSQKMRVVVE